MCAGRLACRVASISTGSGLRLIAFAHHGQIKQHRPRHDGNAAIAGFKANALFGQPAHHAAGGIQTKRAATAQHDGVHLVHQIRGVEQIGFTGAGRGATDIHRSSGPSGREYHRAARQAFRKREVSYQQAGNIHNGA